MAAWTRTDLINRALELVGAKPGGQSASSEDVNLAGDVVDSVFDQLRYEGLADFAISSIPEYAQRPLSKIVACELASDFDVSQAKYARLEVQKASGRRELETQAEGRDQNVTVKRIWF